MIRETKEKPACSHKQAGLFSFGNLRFFSCPNPGQRTLHITAAKTTGADVHPTDGAVHHNTDVLHIGRPDTVTFTVGMTNIVAIQRTFFANLTKLTHGNPPPYGDEHIKPEDNSMSDCKMQVFFSAF